MSKYKQIKDYLSAEDVADELINYSTRIAEAIKRKDNCAFEGRASGVRALLKLLNRYVKQG